MTKLKDVTKHSYLVAATVMRARAVLYEEYINIKAKCPEYPTKWVRAKPELRYIDEGGGTTHLIRHGVSIYQVLNSFDGRTVDEWAFDYTVSKWKPTSEIIQAVRILQQSSIMLTGGTDD